MTRVKIYPFYFFLMLSGEKKIKETITKVTKKESLDVSVTLRERTIDN